MAIEDQRAQRLAALAVRRRHVQYHRIEQSPDIGPLLGRNTQDIFGGCPQHLLDLLRHHVRLGGNQIDLVDDRDDLKVILHGQIQVRQRLRLDPLGRVHDQHCAFARLERRG